MIDLTPEGKFKASFSFNERKYIALFSDKETAEIWLKWKQDLLEKMVAFNPSDSNLITLRKAIKLKIESLNNVSRRTRDDLNILFSCFENFLDLSLDKINFEDLYEIAEKMLNESARLGGNKERTKGDERQISPSTVRRRFANLSAVFGYMQLKGVGCNNPALDVIHKLRALGILDRDNWSQNKTEKLKKIVNDN